MNAEKKVLIAGGHVQAKTGLECQADAGVCVLSGVPLYRECLTPRVARIDRIEKGRYRITKADGRSGGEIESPDRRTALLAWYDTALAEAEEACEAASAAEADAIQQNAIRIFRHAMASGGVKIGGWAGIGYRAVNPSAAGPNAGENVRTNDLFRLAGLMGLVCHLRGNYVFFAATESEIGRQMQVIFGSGDEV
jgi:hypothetical protein